MSLSEKQELWAKFRAGGMDPKEAAEAAGYSRASGAGVKNENNEALKALVCELKARAEKIAPIGEVFEYFTDIMRGKAGEGESVKLAERTKAAEMLVKKYEALMKEKSSAGIRVVFDVPRPKGGGNAEE